MAEYRSQQIKRGSISEILQLLKGFSSGHEQAKKNLNQEFSLYEKLIGAAPNTEALMNLKNNIQDFSSRSEEYETFAGLNDYLDTVYNQKFDITQQAEMAYSKGVQRYETQKDWTDDDVQLLIMGNPLEGVDGMDINEITKLRNNLLTTQSEIERGIEAGVKFGKGMSGKALVAKYNTYLGQTDAAIEILQQNQNAFTGFAALSQEQRQMMSDMHENLIISVFSGDEDKVKTLTDEAIGNYKNIANRNRKLADGYKSIIQQYFKNMGDTVPADALYDMFKELTPEGEEVIMTEELKLRLQNVGFMTRDEVLAEFQNAAQTTKDANDMYKVYTGKFLFPEYGSDLDDQFRMEFGFGEPKKPTLSDGSNLPSKDQIINPEILSTDPDIRDPKMFKEFYSQRERGGKTSLTIKRFMEDYNLSRNEVMEILNQQEQIHGKEIYHPDENIYKHNIYNDTYEWVRPSDRKPIDKRHVEYKKIKQDRKENIAQENLLTKNIDDSSDKEEFLSNRGITLGVADTKLVTDKQFISQGMFGFTNSVVQESISSYMDSLLDEKVINSVKGNAGDIQKVIDELNQFIVGLTGRVDKLKNSPLEMREPIDNIAAKARTVISTYINLLYPKELDEGYTTEAMANEKFRDGYLVELEEMLDKFTKAYPQKK